MRKARSIGWLVKMSLIVCLAVSGLLATAKTSYALSYEYGTFPKGNVGLARPDIGAEVKLGENKKADSYHFYLNGQEKSVTFDPDADTYTYRPDADLAPGNYSARFVFSLSGYQPATLDWSFTIMPNATVLSSTTTAEQQQGLKAINDYRAKLGLTTVKFSSALNMAAQKHAEYLDQNKVDAVRTAVSLHDEDPSLPGYFGQKLADRLQYVGYATSGGEDVSYNRVTLVQAVDSLFDAPYHRSPFMVPGLKEIGIYKKGDYQVIEFGYTDGGLPELAVSPAGNDVYVPTSFDGHEVPDPLRGHPQTDYPVGYPIMATVNGSNVKKVSLVDSQLKDENGKTVNLLVNTPDNDDHLDTGVILLPSKPLQLDTSYTAKIKLNAELDDGTTKTFEKEWTFRTEPLDGLGVLKLHQDAVAYTSQMANFGLNRTHTVTFGLNDSAYKLDMVSFPMKQRPYIEDGTSYLYIRDLAAALGAEVTWDDQQKAAIYKKKDKTIVFYTTRGAYSLNGTEHETDSPAQLVQNTTMIPVRLLSETLGAKVSYVDSTRTVVINY